MGFDLILDEKLKAWVLEVNDHPSLNIYHSTEFLDTRPKHDEDVCPIDLYVKSRVVKDCINLARKTDYHKHSNFRTLSQIFP